MRTDVVDRVVRTDRPAVGVAVIIAGAVAILVMILNVGRVVVADLVGGLGRGRVVGRILGLVVVAGLDLRWVVGMGVGSRFRVTAPVAIVVPPVIAVGEALAILVAMAAALSRRNPGEGEPHGSAHQDPEKQLAHNLSH